MRSSRGPVPVVEPGEEKAWGALPAFCEGFQESEAKFFTVHGEKRRDSSCELKPQRSVFIRFFSP